VSEAVDRSTAARPGAVLAVLSLAAFVATLDLFIVNVAFPAIGRDFSGSSLPDLSWVLNGYAVLFAALLVPLGRLSDRYGRLRGFLGGLALFTAASAACAVAPGLWCLVAFRCLQAVGAAALTPTSLGLLLAATPAAGRVRAVRIWAAVGAVAAAFGPSVGGLLVQADWRLVFLINVPVGALALVMAVRVVPDSRDPAMSAMPDLLGSAVLAVSIAALTLGLVQGSSWGWGSAREVVALVVAAAGLGLFARRSGRHPLPVVEPALLRVRTFAWSNATAILFSVAFGAGLLSRVLWLQSVWHYSAIRTGLAIAPGPLMVPLATALGQRLTRRGFPAGRLTALGCALFGLGSVLTIALVGQEPRYAAELLPGWLVGGLGVGFALPTILSTATADLPAERTSTGSGVISMSRQIGLSLGVSVFVAVLGMPVGYAAVHSAYVAAWWTMAVAALAGAATSLGMSNRRVAAVPVVAVEPVTVALAD
jgi:EmrB/QacA subfamily drug resistance transporter